MLYTTKTSLEWKTSSTLVPYPEARAFMESYVEKIKKESANDLIWLLEHPSLFTRGLQSQPTDVLTPTFPIFDTGRGGQVTYHGPGQRVAYVMVDLKKYECDIKKYVAFLEEWIIRALALLEVKGERRAGRIGVWVVTPEGEKKISAIGVRVHRWITSHGIALNVCNDLAPYQQIIPCGLPSFGVTSLKELGVTISLGEVDELLRKTFPKVFEYTFSI